MDETASNLVERSNSRKFTAPARSECDQLGIHKVSGALAEKPRRFTDVTANSRVLCALCKHVHYFRNKNCSFAIRFVLLIKQLA